MILIIFDAQMRRRHTILFVLFEKITKFHEIQFFFLSCCVLIEVNTNTTHRRLFVALIFNWICDIGMELQHPFFLLSKLVLIFFSFMQIIFYSLRFHVVRPWPWVHCIIIHLHKNLIVNDKYKRAGNDITFAPVQEEVEEEIEEKKITLFVSKISEIAISRSETKYFAGSEWRRRKNRMFIANFVRLFICYCCKTSRNSNVLCETKL